MKFAQNYITEWHAGAVDNPPVLRVEIRARALVDSPIVLSPRLGANAAGGAFDGYEMRIAYPDDNERRQPRATLEFANVDDKYLRELFANDLSDATVALLVCPADAPGETAHSQTLSVVGAKAKGKTLTLELTHPVVMERNAVNLFFNEETMPATAKGATA